MALFWLSDEAWAAIEPHLPKNQPGARRVDDRRVATSANCITDIHAPMVSKPNGSDTQLGVSFLPCWLESRQSVFGQTQPFR